MKGSQRNQATAGKTLFLGCSINEHQLRCILGRIDHGNKLPIRRQRLLEFGRHLRQRPGGRALYMAALVAAHSNRQLKAFYQRLRAAGKPAKVALTAVMRKFIVLMNHILKSSSFALQN